MLSLNKWLPAFSVPLQLWLSGAQSADRVSIQGTLLQVRGLRRSGIQTRISLLPLPMTLGKAT